jgi:NitT/TauT family transport system permease protein
MERRTMASTTDPPRTTPPAGAPEGTAAALPATSKRRRRLNPRTRDGLESLGLPILAIAVAVIAWWLVSLFLGSRFVPSPAQTVSALVDLGKQGEIGSNLGITLARVVGGFLAALLVGVVIGTVMGLSRRGEKALDLIVMVALTVPSLCYIIVAFLWMGLTETATVSAIGITTFPVIAVNVWSGVKSIDQRLIDMARVFGVPRRRRTLRVVLPQILPYVMAAARYGFGVAWKVTVFVELIGRSNGVGYQLNYAFQTFQMPDVFAWTLLFTVVMVAIELLFFKPLESRLFKWRPNVRG